MFPLYHCDIFWSIVSEVGSFCVLKAKYLTGSHHIWQTGDTVIYKKYYINDWSRWCEHTQSHTMVYKNKIKLNASKTEFLMLGSLPANVYHIIALIHRTLLIMILKMQKTYKIAKINITKNIHIITIAFKPINHPSIICTYSHPYHMVLISHFILVLTLILLIIIFYSLTLYLSYFQ